MTLNVGIGITVVSIYFRSEDFKEPLPSEPASSESAPTSGKPAADAQPTADASTPAGVKPGVAKSCEAAGEVSVEPVGTTESAENGDTAGIAESAKISGPAKISESSGVPEPGVTDPVGDQPDISKDAPVEAVEVSEESKPPVDASGAAKTTDPVAAFDNGTKTAGAKTNGITELPGAKAREHSGSAEPEADAANGTPATSANAVGEAKANAEADAEAKANADTEANGDTKATVDAEANAEAKVDAETDAEDDAEAKAAADAGVDREFDPRKVQFQYGNYNRYYGYRNGGGPDARLACLEPEWFKGLDVLDVGCNIGHVTLTVARDYQPRRCVGLDIDASLIKVRGRGGEGLVARSGRGESSRELVHK